MLKNRCKSCETSGTRYCLLQGEEPPSSIRLKEDLLDRNREIACKTAKVRDQRYSVQRLPFQKSKKFRHCPFSFYKWLASYNNLICTLKKKCRTDFAIIISALPITHTHKRTFENCVKNQTCKYSFWKNWSLFSMSWGTTPGVSISAINQYRSPNTSSTITKIPGNVSQILITHPWTAPFF